MSSSVASRVLLVLVLWNVKAVFSYDGIPSNQLAERVDKIQQELAECGPIALCLCLNHFGHDVNRATLIEAVAIEPGGVPLSEILRLAQEYEGSAEAVLFDPPHLMHVPTPSILILEDVHCVVYCGEGDFAGQVKIFDPQDERVRTMCSASVLRKWDGKAIVFRRGNGKWRRWCAFAVLTILVCVCVYRVHSVSGRASVGSSN